MVGGMSDAPKLSSIMPSAATPEHKAAAPRTVRAAVLTVSDTRTAETDSSGDYLRRELLGAGHEVTEKLIVRDDAVEIRAALTRLIREADIVLTTGGTGIAGRDVTIPVVESLLVKPIPGFGEIFRMLSYDQVGGAAMLSRATGGLTRGALLFAVPGSLNAVQTAWEGILKEEVSHLVYEVARHGQPHTLQGAPAQPEVGRHASPAPTSVAANAAASQAQPQHPDHVNQGASAGIGRHSKVPGATPSRYDPE